LVATVALSRPCFSRASPVPSPPQHTLGRSRRGLCLSSEPPRRLRGGLPPLVLTRREPARYPSPQPRLPPHCFRACGFASLASLPSVNDLFVYPFLALGDPTTHPTVLWGDIMQVAQPGLCRRRPTKRFRPYGSSNCGRSTTNSSTSPQERTPSESRLVHPGMYRRP
jgi:hypothetical protein